MLRRLLALALLAAAAVVWLLLPPAARVAPPAAPHPTVQPPPREPVEADLRAAAPFEEEPSQVVEPRMPGVFPSTRQEALAMVAEVRARMEAEADARLEVVLLNLPEPAQGRTLVDVHQETAPGSGHTRPGLDASAQRVGEHFEATVPVVSGRAASLVISGPGLRLKPLREPVVLAPGETRRIEIDVASECRLRVRVVGLPAHAGTLTLLYHDAHTTGGALTRRTRSSARVVLDAEGRASFLVPALGAVGLTLQAAGESRFAEIALVDRATGARSWDLCVDRDIEVEPLERLVALAPTDGTGRILEDLPYSILLEGVTSDVPARRPGGCTLVRASQLEASPQVRFATLEFSILAFEASHGVPLGEGVLGFDVTSARGQGSLRVEVRGSLPEHLTPHLWALDAEGRASPLVALESAPTPAAAAPVRAAQYELESLADGYLFRRLPAGRFRFHWRWSGGFRAAGPDIEVLEGRETRLQVDALDVRRVRGRVLDWEAIPPRYRPLFVRFGPADEPIVEGRFEASVSFPLDEAAVLRGRDLFVWRAPGCVAWDEASQELLVRCPFERLATVTLSVPPLHGGTLKAAHLGATLGAGELMLQPVASGALELIQTRGLQSDAIVYEFAGGWILRGWLRLRGEDETLSLPMAGREVVLSFDRPGGSVRLHAVGPAVPGAPLPTIELTTLDTGGPAVVWLPWEATAVLVDAGSGPPLRVALRGDETTLTLSVP